MAFQHAIIIGGGIAGLLAARVLTDSCEHITIIERDQYPETPAFRAGAPQARQIHAFPLQVQQLLEVFFPGFGASILAAGARMLDYASQGLYFYGARCPRIAPGLIGWSASRMLVEWQMYQEVRKDAKIEWIQQAEVKGLVYGAQGRRVEGVKYQEKGNLAHPIHHLSGDVVIDASGSSSVAPQWLKEGGYEPPIETSINPVLGYATRMYECPKDAQSTWWWRGIAIQGTGQKKRAGAIMEIEGGRWMVLLAGSGGDYPPTDPEGYLAFAHSLPEPTLYEAIKEARPLSKMYGYRPIGNRWRHYERMNMPQGLLVMGDSVCTFNPIYGQGITVAALEAQALATCLRTWHQRKDPSRHFQRQVARLLASPWLLATLADSTQEHQQTWRERIANWYVMGHVIPAIPRDVKVERLFLEILHMLRSPLALLHPAIVVRVVMRSSMRKKTAHGSEERGRGESCER